MKIAITGASGFLGRGLVQNLLADGHALLLVGRDVLQVKREFPDIPACDYATLESHLDGVDAIIHAAVLNNDAAADETQFRAVNVDLLRQVAAQAAAKRVRLFINLTTLQALEPPFRNLYALSKHEGEAALAQQAGLLRVNVRLAAVYTDRFRGKLAVLNAVPRPLRRIAFAALAALRPTVSFDRVVAAIKDVLASPPPDRTDMLLTDGQGRNFFYRAFNRLVDYGFALTVIVLLWWLLIAAWVAIKLTSPGPAIFRQQRIGRGKVPFTCYKFRTMGLHTRQAATHEMTEDAITTVGKWMRRLKIDELPQAWNLLRGDMSLVGPRPCLPTQQALVDWRAKLGVLAVRPGITGLAQTRGVDMRDPERLSRLDAQYIACRGVLLDLKIILATARGSGAQDYVSKGVVR